MPNPEPSKSILRWQFCTEFYDIGFGLDFEPATPEGIEPELKTLLAVNRIMADEAVSIGNHVEASPHTSPSCLCCPVVVAHRFLLCSSPQPAAKPRELGAQL